MQSLIGLSLRNQQIKYKSKRTIYRWIVLAFIAAIAAGLCIKQYFLS